MKTKKILTKSSDFLGQEIQKKQTEFPWTKKILPVILIVSVILLISLLLSVFTSLTFLSSLRIIFGSIYVLFLPGFIISYIFFPYTSKSKDFDSAQKSKINKISDTREFDKNRKDEGKKSIDWIERIALSFALSIAIVPLAVFYLNLIGVKINLTNSFLTILGILLISSIILAYKNHKK